MVSTEKTRQYQRKYFQKHRVWHYLLRNEKGFLDRIATLMHYSNPIGRPICNHCGVQDLDVLCIDHITGGGNKQRKETGTNGGIRFYRWLAKNRYPMGYQVLCANCNMRKARYTLDKRELVRLDKIKT